MSSLPPLNEDKKVSNFLSDLPPLPGAAAGSNSTVQQSNVQQLYSSSSTSSSLSVDAFWKEYLESSPNAGWQAFYLRVMKYLQDDNDDIQQDVFDFDRFQSELDPQNKFKGGPNFKFFKKKCNESGGLKLFLTSFVERQQEATHDYNRPQQNTSSHESQNTSSHEPFLINSPAVLSKVLQQIAKSPKAKEFTLEGVASPVLYQNIVEMYS